VPPTAATACLADPLSNVTTMASGQIYLRARHDDLELVSCSSPRPFGAAILYARYLAPYPPDHPRAGQTTTELVDALRAAKVNYVIDPGTPALSKPDIGTVKEAARLRRSPMVAAIGLPLRPDDLRNRARRERFVDDTMAMQAGAAAVAPPYLEYKRGGPDVLRVNLAMVRRCVAAAAGQRAVAFIQLTVAALLDGVLNGLAPAHAATGVTRAFVRVRGLDAEEASAQEFSAYLDAIAAFNEVGIELVPDCVGRLGPPLVAGGALSFSTGPVHFRKVPRALLNKSGGGGVEVFYEVAGGFHAVARSARHGASRCFVTNCAAAAANASLEDLRLHNLHVLREESRLAASNGGAWYAARLIASGQPEAVVWAEVLRERAQRAA
jgi:hypothetical protein